MNPEKPGYLTTEFWTAMIFIIVVLLKAFHVISPDVDVSKIQNSAVAIIQQILDFLTIAAPGLMAALYMKNRTELKSNVLTLKASEQ